MRFFGLFLVIANVVALFASMYETKTEHYVVSPALVTVQFAVLVVFCWIAFIQFMEVTYVRDRN